MACREQRTGARVMPSAGESAGPSRVPEQALTGLVLAGGGSRRMGQDKAFLELGGRPLIEIVIDRLREACAEVLVVAGDPRPYQHLGVLVVKDHYVGVGALGGLHAGLGAASHGLAVAVGCDMPFLHADLLRAFAVWADGFDVAVLRQGGYVEPLHGAYRRTCVAAIEVAIREGQRRIVSFFPRVRVRYVTAAEVAPLDPDLRFIRNVNTPQDWEMVRAEWAAGELRYPTGITMRPLDTP